MLKIISAMFGFIITQPVHVSLRQMRLVSVALITSSQILLWEIVDSLKTLDPTQAAMAYGTIAVTLIAAIWKGIDSLNQGNVKDD